MPLGLDPVVVGTVLAFCSSVGYTGANVCLRSLTHCDPSWVSCMKAFPTVVLVAPCVLCRVLQNQVLVPSARVLRLLVLASLICQLGGNVLFQWALGVIGIALTVPLTLGTMIICGAVLGHRCLGEHVSRRTMLAIWILVAAIFILGLGAPAASRAMAGGGLASVASHSLLLLTGGVVAACVSGVSYCLLGVGIRHAANSGTPVSTILGSVTLVGLLALGILSLWSIGPAAMWNTPPEDLAVMLLAGVCNATGFWLLATALQLVPLVYTNTLNASQSAMAAAAGILFFSRAPQPADGRRHRPDHHRSAVDEKRPARSGW